MWNDETTRRPSAVGAAPGRAAVASVKLGEQGLLFPPQRHLGCRGPDDRRDLALRAPTVAPRSGQSPIRHCSRTAWEVGR